MDRRQKSTLRSHHIHLANELILDEDFFAALRQNKIFTDGMLQIIKDVRKPRDQVYKMLELLEKRGPEAFENFVWILKENFSWIADKLEETYQMKQSREKSAHHTFQRAMSTPQESRRKVRQKTSVRTPPASAKSFQSLVGKKVNFKNDSPEPSDCTDVDNEYGDMDEQDGGATYTSKTKHNSEIKTIVKKFADKCISPIQIIESPRKEVNTAVPNSNYFARQEESHICDETDSKDISESVENVESEINNENNQGVDMEADESVFDDDPNETGEFNELNVEDENAEFEDGEIFYDRIRSEMYEAENNDSFELGTLDDVDGGFEQTLGDETESHVNTSLEFCQTEEDSEIQDMYLKLVGATNTNLDSESDLSQIGITYKMINELIDKLVEDKQNGEESVKMIKKCASLFPDKDRKFPLNKNIEKLMEEKADINNRLFEEIRKTNEMAHDMYIHSQEMKNLDKLKARMSELERENSLLQMKKLNVERENQEKDRRINELEKNMKIFEEIRQNGAVDKKSMTRRNSQRRIMPGMPSPRKPSLGPGSTTAQRSNPAGPLSPRPGASSAWPRHYSKR